MSDKELYLMTVDSLNEEVSAELTAEKIRHFKGKAHLSQIVELPEDRNVREGRPEKNWNGIHEKIKATGVEVPHLFPILNTGITIIADDIEVKGKKIKLLNPSIINGSQTTSVGRTLLGLEEKSDPLANIELIVTSNKAIADRVTISRNTISAPKAISLLGAIGAWDRLGVLIKARYGKELVYSETDSVYGTFNPIRIIYNAIALLDPMHIQKYNAGSASVFRESNRICLSAKKITDMYSDWYERSIPSISGEKPKAEDVEFFEFFVQFANAVWGIYLTFVNNTFSGDRPRTINDSVRKLINDGKKKIRLSTNPQECALIAEEWGYLSVVMFSLRPYITVGARDPNTGLWDISFDLSTFDDPQSDEGKEKVRDYINTYRKLFDQKAPDGTRIPPNEVYKRSSKFKGAGTPGDTLQLKAIAIKLAEEAAIKSKAKKLKIA